MCHAASYRSLQVATCPRTHPRLLEWHDVLAAQGQTTSAREGPQSRYALPHSRACAAHPPAVLMRTEHQLGVDAAAEPADTREHGNSPGCRELSADASPD